MVGIPLGMTTYRRRGARTAEVALVNMMIEKDPTNQVDGLVRYQRPALTQFASVGTGPIRAVFQRSGVLSSVYLVVSGTALYSVSSSGASVALGTIPGVDICEIDGISDRAIIVADGRAYSTDGTTIVQVNMPDIDSFPSLVSSVMCISEYFILSVADSGHFFWLAPGDVDPDALNFATAENSPDNLICARRLLDEVWMFGAQTVEVWVMTGNLNSPFQPIGGRLYERGAANRDAIRSLDNSLFWVGNDLIAYRADTTPVRISDHSMEERLREAGAQNLSAWTFSVDGHTLYSVRCADNGTFVFDVENQNWSLFKSYGQKTWRAHCGAQITGDIIVAGDDTTGQLWSLDSTLSNDDGSPLERELTGGITVLGSPQKCRNLSVRTAVGWAPITGNASNPLLLMRFSDDGGNTWSSWLEMSLGTQGQYNAEVVWRQLGLIVEPGRLFTLRCTDDALLRVSYARMNEAESI